MCFSRIFVVVLVPSVFEMPKAHHGRSAIALCCCVASRARAHSPPRPYICSSGSRNGAWPCSPSVSLVHSLSLCSFSRTASCSALLSSRAATSLAPPLPRHHRASQHRLCVCFWRLDRLPNPSSAAVRRLPCRCRHNSRRRGMPPHTWPGGPQAVAGRAVGQARPRLRPAESSPPLPALSAEPDRSKL